MQITVTIRPDLLAEWLLHLCLLRYGLAPSLTVADREGSSPRLWIGLEPGDEPAGRFRGSGEELLLYVTRAAMDYWIHFFLCYYTTGRPSGDHIDVLPEPDKGAPRRHLQLVLQTGHRGVGWESSPAKRTRRRR